MAPGLSGFLDPTRNLGFIDGRRRAQSDEELEGLPADEMALLEETYEDSEIQVGEEVEVFARFLDDCGVSRGSTTERRANLFKLVDQYYDFVNDRAKVLRERERLAKDARAGDDNFDMDTDDLLLPAPDSTELQRWEEETQTWDLLRRLLPLRYQDKATAACLSTGADRPPQSRREYWADFLLSDPKARERKTVLEWLQRSASTGPAIDDLVKEHVRNANRGDIVAHGWIHTRGEIKMHKRLVASSEPLPPDARELGDSNLEVRDKLVTQLDPDVVSRQGRKLKKEDKFFEMAIWRGCYELLRRGSSMTKIRDWCQERTEVWRAATVSALPLSDGDEEDVPNFDPYPTVLWRRMCSKLAQDGSIQDKFERAAYGILAGDVSSIDAVCETWDDYTFAKYNAELRSQFDAYLAKHCDPDDVESLSMLHGDVMTPAASREREQRTRSTISTPAKALQAAIIEDRLDTYLYQQGLALAEEANKESPSLLIPPPHGGVKAEDRTKYFGGTDFAGLRILAHIRIVLSALDELDGKDAWASPRYEVEEHAVAAYTIFLRQARLEELIPLYASRLQGERCYANLCRNLIHLDSVSRREELIHLIEALGLDVVRFVTSQPALVLSQILAENRTGLGAERPRFSIFQDDSPNLKYGRLIQPNIFGVDSDDSDGVQCADRRDEDLVRAMEWLLQVGGLLEETCAAGVGIYKYLLLKGHLDAARLLQAQVPLSKIIKHKTSFGHAIRDEADPAWWDDLFADAGVPDPEEMDEDSQDDTGHSRRGVVAELAQPLWELECLVSALDCLETTAYVALGHQQDATRDREVAVSIDRNAKLLNGFMKPLLNHWLLHPGTEGPEYAVLREIYLPEVILGYASTLQFAGTTTSRDYLLECMELSSVIADPDSDLPTLFEQAGRLEELLASFASCSKALAIWTSDMKKGPGASSKKLRELGWSRELWAIKS